MRTWLLNILVGEDEFLKKALELTRLRAVAVAQHTANKELRWQLAQGELNLSTLRASHADTKEEIQKLYTLELD